MQGGVHKRKKEVDLWEVVTTDRTMTPGSRSRRQESTKAASGRSAKPLQIIGQDENIRPARQRRPAQSARQARAVQSVGREQYNRSSGAEQYNRPLRQERPVSRSRHPQASGMRQSSLRSGELQYGRAAEAGRYRTQPVRQNRQEYSPKVHKRRRTRKARAYLYRSMAFGMAVFCAVLVFLLVGLAYKSVREWRNRDIVPVSKTPVIEEEETAGVVMPNITLSYLDINEYSRPGTKLEGVNSIFVHYTANAGTSAEQNRSYFSNLAQTHERWASAHFIIGCEGEIIQCIPLEEQAFGVKTRNDDSISIECCYLEKDGEFTQATYNTLIQLLAWLIQEYDLETDDILRHYDCGGKKCPLYYVENEDAWNRLRADVAAYLEKNSKE